MLGTTISNLKKQVERYPEKTFIISEAGDLTYRQYDERVNQLANLLHENGIGRKDNVGLLMYNCPELYVAILATHKLGAVACLWNFRLTAANVDYLVQSTDAKGIVFNGDFLNKVPAGRPSLKLCVQGGKPLPDDVMDFPSAVNRRATTPPSTAGPNEEDIATVIYTSGTTGNPKGAAYSHGVQLISALQYSLEMGLERNRRGLSAAPVIHGAATNFFMAYLFIGGSFIDSGNYDPGNLLKLIKKFGATELMAVPTQIQQMIDVARSGAVELDIKTLRLIRSGGSPYTKALVEDIHEVFNCHFLNTFGMTENLSNVTAMHSGIDPEDAWTTIGKATYFWDVRVVRIDESGAGTNPNDRIRTPGRGQIILKGPQNIKDYYCSSEKPVLKDDWLFARDVVDVDEQGYMQIVDRVDESIISGGENVYPQEVELFLQRHPLIADVAVFGVPDKKWGGKNSGLRRAEVPGTHRGRDRKVLPGK